MQRMGRRQFGKTLAMFAAGKSLARLALIAATGGAATMMSGCGITVADIQAWIPTGIQAITNLLNLLGATGVIPIGVGTLAGTLLAAIKQDFMDILSDIQQWKDDPADTSLLTKVQQLLQSVSTQLSDFLSPLLIPSMISALISGLLGLILSTLAGFISAVAEKLGATADAAAAGARRTITMRAVSTIAVEPLKIKREEFIKQFNAQLEAHGQSAYNLK